MNLCERQLAMAAKQIDKLHEDLQMDYEEELKELNKEIRAY
jgi:phosphoglycerate-specific signal transduction histidine kinase